jgi:hypothetical protein
MAATCKLVPANERVSKLFKVIQRYDIDDLLVAATFTRMTRPAVITSNEKRDIEKQGGSKREKLDRLITLVTKSAERMTRFAAFIKWYTSPIQKAADAVLECQDSPAAVDSVQKSETVTNSQVQNEKAFVADQRSQRSFSDSSSAAQRTIPKFVDTGTANSQEQYSMEIQVCLV